jgi:hypothetical protein
MSQNWLHLQAREKTVLEKLRSQQKAGFLLLAAAAALTAARFELTRAMLQYS